MRTGAVTRQGRHRGEQHLQQRPLSRPPRWASPQSPRPCDQRVLDITVAVTCHKVNGDHCERTRTCVHVDVRVCACPCLCACVYVCMRVHVRVCVRVHVRAFLRMRACSCVYRVCVYACACLCMCVRLCVHVGTCACVCACTCVRVRLCACVCTCVCACTDRLECSPLVGLPRARRLGSGHVSLAERDGELQVLLLLPPQPC